MLKTLLKKQMAEIFRNYFYDPKKNKMRSRGATIAYIALYALLMVGLLGGMFALMAVGLCGPLVEGGMGWLYYLLMGLIAVFLGTFGSVFSTYSSLYLSKDNDLLLSLPIPVRCVMASRLLGVYLLGLMYAAVVIVPGVIVYWLTAPVTAGTIVGGVLMVLIVSVIVMVLSCLLGWVVARISLKLKNKSFITVLLSLLFLAAYYFVYYKVIRPNTCSSLAFRKFNVTFCARAVRAVPATQSSIRKSSLIRFIQISLGSCLLKSPFARFSQNRHANGKKR